MRRWALAAALVAVGIAALPAPASAACPNEALRAAQGSLPLPECRAYELVTPGAFVGSGVTGRTAPDGDALAYYTTHPAPSAATSSYFYLARRGGSGWSYETVAPQNVPGSNFDSDCEANAFFSEDLAENIFEAGWANEDATSLCKRPEPLVAGEPTPYRNVFLHDVASDSYRLLNVAPAEATPANAVFQTGSADLSVSVFGEAAQLTPGAPSGYDFYVAGAAALRLLTVLPDGTDAPGELVEATNRPGFIGSGSAPFTGALSADGGRAFFYSGNALYTRVNPAAAQSAVVAGHCTQPQLACTTQVDASQGPGPGGGGVFWRATPSGSAVFFSDDNRLTPDATAEPGEPDLYRYDTGTGQLVDLTADTAAPADVQGVAAMGGNGSYLYFVANGALAAGAAPGDCTASLEAPGHCNLYVLHEGTIGFLARLSQKDESVWQVWASSSPREKSHSLEANASPDGRYLAFVSSEPLTGYDSSDATTGSADPEVFLYDAVEDQLACASCPPGRSSDYQQTLLAAESFPGFFGGANWLAETVLDDGSLFFGTANAISAGDSNEAEDVYVYRDHQAHLISPAGASGGASIVAVDPSGQDVFFTTAQTLVRSDADNGSFSLYDARIDGGFAEAASPIEACEDSGCRGPLLSEPAFTPPPTELPPPPRRRHCGKRSRCHGRHGHRKPRKHHHRRRHHHHGRKRR